MPSMRALCSEWCLVSFFLWCLALVIPVSFSLSPSCGLCRIQKTFVKLRRDTLIHRRNQSAPRQYCIDISIAFTDWSLFVVVVLVVLWYRAQRLYRRLCDWYHMKGVVVRATEYRHYSEGFRGKMISQYRNVKTRRCWEVRFVGVLQIP